MNSLLMNRSHQLLMDGEPSLLGNLSTLLIEQSSFFVDKKNNVMNFSVMRDANGCAEVTVDMVT